MSAIWYRRYKLFGDTVNMASRMESTSLPGHIQLSETCYLSLCVSSKRGYETKPRGGITVKGKGDNIQTFWLIGLAEVDAMGTCTFSRFRPLNLSLSRGLNPLLCVRSLDRFHGPEDASNGECSRCRC